MQPKEKYAIADNSPEARDILMKALFRIGERWNLNDARLAQLLRKDRSQITRWKKPSGMPIKLDLATKEALQNLIAIYRSLGAIFQSTGDQVKWLGTKHPDFDDAPLSLMGSSMDGLFTVRKYLDYVRGRGA